MDGPYHYRQIKWVHKSFSIETSDYFSSNEFRVGKDSHTSAKFLNMPCWKYGNFCITIGTIDQLDKK